MYHIFKDLSKIDLVFKNNYRYWYIFMMNFPQYIFQVRKIAFRFGLNYKTNIGVHTVLHFPENTEFNEL